MNWITNSAAMLVVLSGTSTSRKKRIGPAPSMRAASTNSSGTVRRTGGRGRCPQVADAITAPSARIAVEHGQVGDHLRRSAGCAPPHGNISVNEHQPEAQPSSGKRKYTNAKADSSEMAILPRAIVIALTKLIHNIGATGATFRHSWSRREQRNAIGFEHVTARRQRHRHLLHDLLRGLSSMRSASHRPNATTSTPISSTTWG